MIFVAVILLNGFKKNTAASYGVVLTVNASLVYFSAIFGAIVEVHLAFIFLFGVTFLLFKPSSGHRTISVIIAALTLVLCEINFYYQLVPPILTTRENEFLVRWLAMPGIIFLDALVIWFYKKDYDTSLLNLKRTMELEAANMAKNFFIRVTNHEQRAPLNAIHEISQTLLMYAENNNYSPEDIKRLAEDLYAASNNAVQQVNNVLDMSQIEAGRINEVAEEPVNINQFLTNLAKVYQYSANTKGVEILTELRENLPVSIISDKGKLTKVISNLLINAIKFTRDKTTVSIKAYKGDKLLYISVQDQGKGIDAGKTDRIFEPFETEKNALIEGTGLGLYITKHFVQLLKGTIAVTSNSNGTTFTVNIPLRIGKEESEPSSVSNSEQSICKGKKVLICEDNSMSQLYLLKFLERSGCRPFLANNGIEGIEIALKEQLDLILIDSHMPKMSGRETIEYIRKHPRLKHLPIIAISGDSAHEEIEQLLQAGANDYILKPISFKLLNNAMHKHLAISSVSDNTIGSTAV
ncbi:signal transduction histidine kinase [Chitinophaga japonensis]|uniref:histidine kinase n=2 Tax=Chitinophaga japonensis TaxID=104662 RepID=A0A562SZ88_CHIJA|nr:signal transduction histidine kinase [Chitinophaga japonensis]